MFVSIRVQSLLNFTINKPKERHKCPHLDSKRVFVCPSVVYCEMEDKDKKYLVVNGTNQNFGGLLAQVTQATRQTSASGTIWIITTNNISSSLKHTQTHTDLNCKSHLYSFSICCYLVDVSN